MTKKHFIAMAAEIKQIESKKARKAAAVARVKVCQAQNPAFNESRFLTACGIEG